MKLYAVSKLSLCDFKCVIISVSDAHVTYDVAKSHLWIAKVRKLEFMFEILLLIK